MAPPLGTSRSVQRAQIIEFMNPEQNLRPKNSLKRNAFRPLITIGRLAGQKAFPGIQRLIHILAISGSGAIDVQGRYRYDPQPSLL